MWTVAVLCESSHILAHSSLAWHTYQCSAIPVPESQAISNITEYASVGQCRALLAAMAAPDEVMLDVERAEPTEAAVPIVQDEISWETFSEDEADELDTTAEQLCFGKDLQGIPWQNLQFTRNHYRTTRLKQYNNYTNVIAPGSTDYR